MDYLNFPLKTIKGDTTTLSAFKGDVILLVNVASQCGNTPQYAGLEKMYEKYKGKGFAVLGFPANQFHAQEPGTDAEIKEFCEATYHVKFPMFSKIVVKGDGIHPLYQWLLAQTSDSSDIDWNFAKFLIGRDGKVITRFKSSVKPDDPALVEAVEKALG